MLVAGNGHVSKTTKFKRELREMPAPSSPTPPLRPLHAQPGRDVPSTWPEENSGCCGPWGNSCPPLRTANMAGSITRPRRIGPMATTHRLLLPTAQTFVNASMLLQAGALTEGVHTLVECVEPCAEGVGPPKEKSRLVPFLQLFVARIALHRRPRSS